MTKKSEVLLEAIVRGADDRLATDIVALDVANITPMADYFVIMSGRNDRQVKAIVEAVEEAIEEADFKVKGIEGQDGNRWILIDAFDVIIHVFTTEERGFYNLEKMWSEAPLVNIEEWIS
ncbi:ribosome silencing factor [Aerococcus urinaeequi]|uniref:Ribosomal silencing factor RsfS n=1 Tax=Aerococcus viridans TaxID=1377 RepID=A0A2N6UBM6_9LACT|nr:MULTISPECIES: ribosome silencing factor [Aerococcus]OFU51335.1 ribosome silencing factor RsfS [Aerococcus sp. HMSC10H05]PMC78960.1 ribosome silencing factor [Aerococcus viridans]